MTNKTARNFLTVFAAFGISLSFVGSSLAGEFTVKQGKRYRATLALKSAEQLADNALIARKFRALGSLRCVSQVQERRAKLRAFNQARM
jgi:hypothetical protein